MLTAHHEGEAAVTIGPAARDPALELLQIDVASADVIAGGQLPNVPVFAADYPTEFSLEVALSIRDGEPIGPFFLLSTTDGLVVGEIGGTVVQPGTVEIGYAVVESARGRGFATAAVAQFVERARAHPAIERLSAHTPLDRAASERVLAKTGFACTREMDDEYFGAVLRVREWELCL
jgi:RimJ/RimL family protein N-acetyltransferase